MEVNQSEYKEYWESGRFVLVKMQHANGPSYTIIEVNSNPKVSNNKLFHCIIENDKLAFSIIEQMLEHNCKVYDSMQKLREDVGEDFPYQSNTNWPF